MNQERLKQFLDDMIDGKDITIDSYEDEKQFFSCVRWQVHSHRGGGLNSPENIIMARILRLLFDMRSDIIEKLDDYLHCHMQAKMVIEMLEDAIRDYNKIHLDVLIEDFKKDYSCC